MTKRGRKPFFWLMSSLMTLMLGGVSVVAANAATKTHSNGTIEICKSADNGMAGRSFKFSLNGANPITVAGGGCSAPISTPWGENTVSELPTSGLVVAAITSNHLVSADEAHGSAVVRVHKGSTAADETVVTFVNEPNKALGLKICKAADPELVGSPFSFTENGGGAFSINAGTPAAPNCGPVKKYQLGTVVHVAELATPNVYVGSIDVSDNRGSNIDLANGKVDATIGSGVTVVTYTNKVVPTPKNGYIEVCKNRDDKYVSGLFQFTVSSTGSTVHFPVRAGACSGPIAVLAGIATVTEAATPPYYVTAINVLPSGRLVDRNLANQSVRVLVPVGDQSTETLVHFKNATRTSQIKICKAVTSNSIGLKGTRFTFAVTDVNGTHYVKIAAGAPGTTICKLDKSHLPVGSDVSITEESVPNVQVVGVSVAPASQDTGSAPPTARFTVGSGTVTIATFTNEAYGTIEVCKKAADVSTGTQTFYFSINGGTPIAVPAGQCSDPISVPAGTATVYESGPGNFHLVGITAIGPTHDNRLVTGSTDNPATVQVPFGGVENETVATFTNAVNTGEFKICKASPEPTLQQTVFHFTYSYTLPGVADPVSGTADLKPTQCSALSGDIPVVDPAGQPIPVYITEAATASVKVSNVAVANGALVTADYTAGTATINVNEGFTTVTYTNVRTPVQ